MNQLISNILFWGLFVGGGSVFAIFCFITAFKQNINRSEISHSTQTQATEEEFAEIKTRATVIDQTCYVKTVGVKYQKVAKEFVIVFQTDDMKILKFCVPEEMYEGFEKGQVGILTVIDGNLYSFDLE